VASSRRIIRRQGEKRMGYPSDYRYTKEHEWVRVESDIATVGITDYAQHELGDVVYAEMPKPGTKLNAGQSFGTVESVKAVSDIYAPVGGAVTEVNATLGDAPETINKDPHGAGWLIKLKLSDPSEVAKLMTAAAYEAFIAEKQTEASA
jgi:glycine cleavage system H protein